MKYSIIAIITIFALSVHFSSCKKPQTEIITPTITNDKVETTATTATFTWTVDWPGKLMSVVEVSENEDMSDSRYYGSEEETENHNFTVTVTDLKVATKYYYRYLVWNRNFVDNKFVKDIESFNTNTDLPKVKAVEVTDVARTTAKVIGKVTDDCGSEVTERGFCWSTNRNPTLGDGHYSNSNGLGTYSIEITNLWAEQTYYVRAYAINSNGTAYSEEELCFTTDDAILPTLTTSEISNIGLRKATGGGEVTDNGGAMVTECGICWSTSHNPEISDNHANGDGIGIFSVDMSGLMVETTYYVRAYARNSKGISYGNEVYFTTLVPASHGFVDLGLPSGTLWATCNVGSSSPGGYGDYYAWGETESKSVYNWSTYKYCNGSSNTLSKYCNNSNNGLNGFIDDLTVLLPEDDVATANWGSGWRIPTTEDWEELRDNTTVTLTTMYGVKGCRFTASNGNSIFLPAAGYSNDNSIGYNAGNSGIYWSSSLNTNSPSNAWGFEFDVGFGMSQFCYRGGGQSVRPVRSAK